MPRKHFHGHHLTLVVATLMAVTAVSCGKKEAPAPTADAATSTKTTAAEQPNVGAPNRATAAPTPDASLATAQAAMQAKDYERAATTLLAVQQQRQPLTAAQGEALRNQMVSLQQALAAGVASGDPKAKAAADLLRKSTMR